MRGDKILEEGLYENGKIIQKDENSSFDMKSKPAQNFDYNSYILKK